MASVVQVCLALLLVTCVHGQAPAYLNSLTSECLSGAATSMVSDCSLAMTSALGTASLTDAAAIFTAICSNIPAVVTYYGCITSIFATCLSAEYQGLIQTEAKAQDAYQYYCDHRSEFNEACVFTALGSDTCLTNAASAYSTAISQVGLVRATCSYLDTSRGCIYSAGASCANHNRDTYNTFYVKSYPPACVGCTLSPPTSFLLLGACAVLLNKMAAAFLF